jgi:hypothetical protein
MSEYTDKIRAKILEMVDYIEPDKFGHKFGTMHFKGTYQRVCVDCGCAKHSVKAKKPCEGE